MPGKSGYALDARTAALPLDRAAVGEGAGGGVSEGEPAPAVLEAGVRDVAGLDAARRPGGAPDQRRASHRSGRFASAGPKVHR